MKKFLTVLIMMAVIAALNTAATGAQDKELVVGLVQVTNNFDPYGAYGDEAYGHMQVFDTLVNKDPKGRVMPNVAESWNVSNDGLVYELTLREDVKFTDGKPFTAEDARFSVEKGQESPYTNWAMAGVAKCETVAGNKIAITLSAPDVSFMEKLTWIYMVNKDGYTSAGDGYGKTVETTIGTGPYKLTEWRPGELAVFEANQDYFAGPAAIKNVRFETMSDANAAIISLQTGEIGLYVRDVPSISIAALSKNEDVTVTNFPSCVFMDILLNCENGTFADPKARKAIALAVDRGKMFLVGTEGQGVIVDYPGGPDYTANPNIKIFGEPNMNEAAALIKELGLEGKKVVLKTMDTDPWPKLATALQDDLNKAGLAASIEIMDNSAYSQEVWQKGNYEIAISRYWSATKDMCELMNLLVTGHSMNFSRYSNPEADAIIAEASAVRDPAERAKIYERAVKIFSPEIPLIPLFYTNGSRGYSSELTIDEGNVQYDHIFYYRWK